MAATYQAPFSEPFVAELLRRSGSAYAASAAVTLGAPGDEAEAGSGPGFRWWQAFFASRVQDLAAAMLAGQPRLFALQVQWCRGGMRSWDGADEQLHAAMRALRDALVQELPARAKPLIDQYMDAADAALQTPAEESASLLDAGTAAGRLATHYVRHILEGDRRTACDVVRDAVEKGLPVQEAYLHVLVPAAREIGRMWHRNEISIAEEHFATSTTQTVMAQLLAKAPVSPANGQTVLAAAVAGNRHDLGVRVVADFFEMDGWRTIFLGSDVPADELPAAVLHWSAGVLILSAALHTHLPAVESAIKHVRAATSDRPVHVIVGGHAFADAPDLAGRLGADGSAPDAPQAVRLARSLIGLDGR